MKRLEKRILSFVLSLVMLLGLIPSTALAAEFPFTDVKESDWYYDGVRYVYEHSLMGGTGGSLFGPAINTSRAMVVTILYRMEGLPAAEPSAFADVEPDSWYADAVAWATGNGIVNGYSAELFGPNDDVTREQLAVMLYRYAYCLGQDTTKRADLSKYTDAAAVSSWAADAMEWACAEELITGTTQGTLAPQGNATRAQTSMILMRFCEKTGVAAADTVTVTFSENYNGAPADRVVRVAKGTAVPEPKAPRRTNYSFSGWYTDSVGGSRFDFSKAVTESITLYAHWISDTTNDYYSVSFKLNYAGAANAPASQIVYWGSKAHEPEAPTREDYTFVGWYDSPDATLQDKAFDFENTAITRNITLYAQWYETMIQLPDGEIDRAYIEFAILPELFLRRIEYTEIRLSDDYDQDGLTLIEEYYLDTNPFEVDSDYDGISDYDEVNVYGTNPIDSDTDKDGLSDGKEILFGSDPLVPEESFAVTTAFDPEAGINASVIVGLSGAQAESLRIEKLVDDELLPSDMPGYIDDAYEFQVTGDFDEAVIRFAFDETLLDDPDFEPAVYYFNEEDQSLEELETTIEGGVASAEVEHFSKYILLNKRAYESAFEWLDLWQGGGYTRADVVFLIDDSGSMTSNDPGRNRLSVTRDLIDHLPANSRGAILSFTTSVYVYSGLTDDRDALKSKLTTSYFHSSGGTSMYYGINSALGMFDENSEGALKTIVVLTDGETQDASLHASTLQAAVDAGVRIYTVGLGSSTSYFNSYLKPLAEGTDGKFFLASQAGELNAIYESIGNYIDIITDTDEDGIADYFEDHMTLFSGVNIVLNKNDPDTDGDGLYDGEEIVLRYEYNADHTKVKVLGTKNSNPLLVDSDGDGIDDLFDGNPLIFSYVVVEQTEDYVRFNSGKQWSILKCSAKTLYDMHCSNNPGVLMSDFYRDAVNATISNESQRFSKEELYYLALVNNEGVKCYMHSQSTPAERLTVFETLVDRESKYFQHQGILFGTRWVEVPKGTTTGFFSGLVLSEADFNLSEAAFARADFDIIDIVNLGACIITVIVLPYMIEGIATEAAAIGWYIKTFGVSNGLGLYYCWGSRFYLEMGAMQAAENGLLTVINADAADGNLDTLEVLTNAQSGTVWDYVIPTADVMPGTEVPATFQVVLDDSIVYSNPQTGTNLLWVNANATEHFGQYINSHVFDGASIELRSQEMLRSFSSAVNEAMNTWATENFQRHLGNFGGWELGIDTSTGVIFHAFMNG